MFAAKEWEPDLDFSRYNQDFHVREPADGDALYLNGRQVAALFVEHELTAYLDEVVKLMRGRHFGIEVSYHQGRDIRFMCHQHSRRQGVMNKPHATMAGGIRRHTLRSGSWRSSSTAST